MKQLVLSILILGSSICFLCTPEIAAQGVTSGLLVCGNTVFPILFPFLVVSNLWISLGYGQKLGTLLAPVAERIFHLNGNSASALIIGMVGGYPTGAQVTTQLYRTKLISKHDAEALLFFCNNAGPAFLIGVIGSKLFQNPMIGLLLWGIHIISAFLLGFLFRPKEQHTTQYTERAYDAPDFLNALTGAISTAGHTSIRICIFILFFSIVIQYLLQVLFQNLFGAILAGSIELTTGSTMLGKLHLSQELVFVTVSGLAGWGGLCVHFQAISMLNEHGLSCKTYLTGKLLHAIVSSALACLFAPCLALDVPCVSTESNAPIGAVCLLICLLMLLLLKSSSGKVQEYRI